MFRRRCSRDPPLHVSRLVPDAVPVVRAGVQRAGVPILRLQVAANERKGEIMGLDIVAYERLELKAQDLDEEKAYDLVEELYDAGTHTVVLLYGADYSERSAPLASPSVDGQATVYACLGAQLNFRAGFYGGHGAFRDWLCRLASIPEPRTQWAAPEKYAGLPFFELVNFSDCEGVIGSLACAELAKDFATYQEQANAANDEWLTPLYFKWRQAFELAAKDGCVRFC